MTTNINWANPVFDVKTSQNYLARLQEFLQTQQAGTGSNGNIASSGNESNKRKNPSSEDAEDTSLAIKDRKQSEDDQAAHSHGKEGSSERESPEAENGKGRAGKGSTSDKRKEQNRNAQRAFRERKEKVLHDLESKIAEMQKVHENTVSENQNLKELITRLQEENSKLRQPAPQSDFTFTIPTASSSISSNNPTFPPTKPIQDNSALASYSNNDIMAYLSSAPTSQSVQQPFTMIQPSPPAGTTQNGNAGFEDWMMNWNSSAFGTELPQAVPPSVTNLTEQPASNGFASLWNNLNTNTAPTFNPMQTQQVQQNVQQQTTQPDNSSSFFSLFHNAFATSPNELTSPGMATSTTYQVGGNSGDSAASQTSSASPSLFPFANNGGSFSSVTSNSGNVQSLQSRHGSTGQGDSPETSASSGTGSERSDGQPNTPNNGQVLFGGANPTAVKSSDVQNAYTNFGFSTSTGNSPAAATTAQTGLNNMFGTATTPSGVFDMMNYRDPILAGLGGDSSFQDDTFNFQSYNNGIIGNVSAPNQPKRADTLDFNDFLVASPPTFTQSPPVSSTLFGKPSNNGHDSSSASSVPTLGSLSSSDSPSSNHPSPQNSLTTGNSNSASSSSTSTPNWLPYDVTWGHPLIQHVMKDQIEPINNAQKQQDKREFENKMNSLPTAKGPCDIDGLCSDMKLKANCKEAARDRIAKAIHTDEMTMQLYNDYLRQNATGNNH